MFQGSPFTAHCVLFSSTSLVMCHVFVISGSKHEKHMFPSDSWMRFPIYYISQYLQKSWVVKQPKGLVKSDSWHPDVMLVTHTHIEGSWGPSGVWDASPIKSWTTGGTRDGRYGSEQPEHLSAEDPWRSTIIIYADIYDVDWCCYFSMLLTSLAVRTEAWKSDKREENNVYIVHSIHPLHMLYIV